jgi:hypothetical protein
MKAGQVQEFARGVLRRTKTVLHGASKSESPQSTAAVKKDSSGQDWRRILLNEFAAGSVGVEVGTWKGNFAARILGIAKPRTLHLVDPWQFHPEEDYDAACYGGKATGGQAEIDSIYQDVLARFSQEISDGVVVIHRMTSEEAVTGFDDNSLDWVYIDGDHHYNAVKADLELWYPKVRPGGLLTGDDLGTEKWWEDGVSRAVTEFASAPNAPVLTIHGSQFCFRKT